MSAHHNDLEKGAGASSSPIQQPNGVYMPHQDAFPPRYDQAVNDEMRRFPEIEGQTGRFEQLQYEEPVKRGKRRSKAWYIMWTVFVLLLAALFGTGTGLFLTRKSEGNGMDPKTLPTRDVETVVIYTTVTPTPTSAPFSTPETSTVVAVVTQTPSTSQTTPTVTVTSTTSLPIPSPSPTTFSTSTTSTSSVNSAAEASIASELAAISSKLQPDAIPNVSAWLSIQDPGTVTVTLPTSNTETATQVQEETTILPTHTGSTFRCGVPGEAC